MAGGTLFRPSDRLDAIDSHTHTLTHSHRAPIAAPYQLGGIALDHSR